MDIVQIRYFLALCAEGNFTRAAKRCGVAQPSLSNAIRALEQSLGDALFERKPQVRLTPFGETLKPYLAEVWRQLEIAQDVAAGHRVKARARRVRMRRAASEAS
jgi:DNA-binding transcriptional LysR family regulator